jgi:hypothetical protein
MTIKLMYSSPEAESTATDAAPPEIVAEPLSPEAEKAERGGA